MSFLEVSQCDSHIAAIITVISMDVMISRLNLSALFVRASYPKDAFDQLLQYFPLLLNMLLFFAITDIACSLTCTAL